MSETQTPTSAWGPASATSVEALEAVRRAGDAARRPSENAARETEAIAEMTADASGQAAGANRDIVQRGAETAEEVVRTAVETGAHGLESMAQLSSAAFSLTGLDGALAEQSAENTRAISQASTALAQGSHDACRVWLDLMQQGIQHNFEAVSELASCRSIQDLAALQSRLTRETLQRFIEGGQRIAQSSTQAISEADAAIRGQVHRAT